MFWLVNDIVEGLIKSLIDSRFVHTNTMGAFISDGYARPPYHVETFPCGSCVCNTHGFNVLRFIGKPDMFTTLEDATEIADRWNING